MRTQQFISEKYRENVKRRVSETLSHPLNEYSDFVVKTVAERLGFTVEGIKGPQRYPKIVEARYIAMYIINENTSFRDYSASFVNRDRTTFYHMQDSLDGLILYNGTIKVFEELKGLCSLSAYNRKGVVDNK